MKDKEFNLEEIEREIMNDEMVEDEDYRYGWDGDWSKVVDQYDGTR